MRLLVSRLLFTVEFWLCFDTDKRIRTYEEVVYLFTYYPFWFIVTPLTSFISEFHITCMKAFNNVITVSYLV